jgi:hypothetical protein
VSVSNLVASNPAGIRVTGSTLIVYYAYEVSEPKNYIYYFNWVWRDIDDNEHLGTANPNFQNTTKRLYTTTTSDNVSHTAFYYRSSGLADYAILRSKVSSGYWDDIIHDYNLNPPFNQPNHINVSSAGNEVHAIWQDQFGSNNGNNLRYKYDDQVPLAPTNLTIGNENNHPKLQWTKNNEPDVTKYYIYRNPGSGYQYLGQTSSTFYVDETLEYCTVPPPAQCQDINTYSYYVTALDISSNESPPSNSVIAELVGGPPQKAGVTNPAEMIEFSLGQNYPNPFNPSTKISYSIPEDAKVSIKVYDMLGTEIAELLNEAKSAGYYEITFDASSLSSGVYIYRITAFNRDRIHFSQSKQMILLK